MFALSLSPMFTISLYSSPFLGYFRGVFSHIEFSILLLDFSSYCSTGVSQRGKSSQKNNCDKRNNKGHSKYNADNDTRLEVVCRNVFFHPWRQGWTRFKSWGRPRCENGKRYCGFWCRRKGYPNDNLGSWLDRKGQASRGYPHGSARWNSNRSSCRTWRWERRHFKSCGVWCWVWCHLECSGTWGRYRSVWNGCSGGRSTIQEIILAWTCTGEVGACVSVVDPSHLFTKHVQTLVVLLQNLLDDTKFKRVDCVHSHGIVQNNSILLVASMQQRFKCNRKSRTHCQHFVSILLGSLKCNSQNPLD
mmetsp:Transcript_5407/g.12002  ORF Transcript_5407/g.12002 Transcript_5407/m.12002 type:complete len:304 (+) Transcript_5407:31-942(+)